MDFNDDSSFHQHEKNPTNPPSKLRKQKRIEQKINTNQQNPITFTAQFPTSKEFDSLLFSCSIL